MFRRSVLASLGALVLGIPTASRAQFIGELRARFGDDGRTITLLAPYSFVDSDGVRWDVPSGAIVDGASIPPAFYSLIGGPFDGPYRNASVIHDWYCDRRTRKWESVHRVFYEAMLSSGVEPLKAKLMYAAVQKFGPRWSSTVVINNNLAQFRHSLPPPSDKIAASNSARSQAMTSALKRAVPRNAEVSASPAIEKEVASSSPSIESNAKTNDDLFNYNLSEDTESYRTGKGFNDGVSVEVMIKDIGNGVSSRVDIIETRSPSRQEAEMFISQARELTLSQIEEL